MEFESLFDEAKHIVMQRRESYGQPREYAVKIIRLFNELTGNNLTTRDFALLMLCSKLAREFNNHNHDNIIDIMGYADVLNSVTELSKPEQSANMPYMDMNKEVKPIREEELWEKVPEATELVFKIDPKQEVIPISVPTVSTPEVAETAEGVETPAPVFSYVATKTGAHIQPKPPIVVYCEEPKTTNTRSSEVMASNSFINLEGINLG